MNYIKSYNSDRNFFSSLLIVLFLFVFMILFINNNLPLFIYFGLLFFFTTFSSFFLLSALGLYGVFIVNLFSLLLFWVSLIVNIGYIFNNQQFYKISISKWFYVSPDYKIDFSFLIDSVSFSFMFLTISIAVFVYIYAFAYFRYEPLVERFLLFLNSFVISMVFLVTSSNLVMIFLGWEMIGLTSFFLINFWVARVSTLKAGFKAYVFNKFSDFFLFFAMILIYNLIYDLDVIAINSTIQLYTNFYVIIFFTKVNYVELISFFLLLCAFIKSAQIGPHIWLPDSMEAPVPASALIHSATLVSAGIFLILRFLPLFEISTFFYIVVPLVGSLTALYGGFAAMFTSDVKRILAYSTISHCGFLMVLCSTNMVEYVILYLYVHGFFKASVFLCIGNIIRFSRNYQDFRNMGQFYKYLPFECFMTLVCLFNLAGIPFTLGFYIKHLLFLSLGSNIYIYYIVFFNCFFGAVAGLFYSSRLFYNVFFDFKKAKKSIYTDANRASLYSHYYSNTSLIASISILLLVIVSYLVCFYLFTIFTSNENGFSDLQNTNLYSFYTNFSYLTSNSAFNLAFFNYFVIFIILLIITFLGRDVHNSYYLIEFFYLLLTYFIFFSFFYSIFF